jgi:hypothetical protein
MPYDSCGAPQRDGRMGGGPTTAPIVHLTLEGEVAAALRREARRRDVSAVALAYAVLDVVLADQLVAAVLDVDEDAHTPA